MNLPSGFIDMIRRLLGDEADSFIEAMSRPPLTSVRLNSRKPGADFPGAKPVKWCPTGLYLPERPVFTLDPLLHAGAYYVQDASSMIYREVVKRLVTGPVTLLDMCAAPGGKTTAMIDALPDGSRVVANEYVGKRAAILKENLSKWGYPLVSVTNRDTSFFSLRGDSFDIVAVDAPCSGEGMMRKDEDARAQWCPELIEQCATLQRKIVTDAAKVVRPGGYLVYSTCTFNRQENEEVAEFIYNSLGFKPMDMDFPQEWGIPRGIDTNLPVYRFMPHRTDGEGLFLAIFQRPVDPEASPTHHTLQPSFDLGHAIKGADIGSKEKRPGMIKGKPNKAAKGKQSESDKGLTGRSGKGNAEITLPGIEEILSVDFDRTRFPEADVDLPTALAYLRRESVTLSPDTPKGPVVITYKGLPLGMAKNIGSRANNLYPKNWRILMR